MIAQKYAATAYNYVVIAIELLNEPRGWALNQADLRQFYCEGYGRVRQVGNTVVVLYDAFLLLASYNGFMSPSDYNVQYVAVGMLRFYPVILRREMLARDGGVNHHSYQIFDDYLIDLVPWQHRQFTCNSADQYWGADKWTFVGEWTVCSSSE